jgi:hypothetical protein
MAPRRYRDARASTARASRTRRREARARGRSQTQGAACLASLGKWTWNSRVTAGAGPSSPGSVMGLVFVVVARVAGGDRRRLVECALLAVPGKRQPAGWPRALIFAQRTRAGSTPPPGSVRALPG